MKMKLRGEFVGHVFCEPKPEEWANCEVSVDGARNTYKDDMQSYLIITVVPSENPRLQFLN